MAIDYRQLRNITAREIVSAVIRDGFTFDRGSGSHQVYYHSDGRRVTVAFHKRGSTFRRKTLKSMIDQTGWTPEISSGSNLSRKQLGAPHSANNSLMLFSTSSCARVKRW